MKTKADLFAILAVTLCLVVFIGEYTTYSDMYRYDVSADWGDGSVEFSVTSSGSDVYSAVLIDNGGFDTVVSLAIYVDGDYGRYADQLPDGVGTGYADQQYHAEQIANALENRSFTDVVLLDSAGLSEYLENTSESSGHGLLVLSYALPSSVYTGHPEDSLIQWISSGGTLYWVGSEVGRYYTEDDRIHEVPTNQHLFFGKECINTSGPEIADASIDNGFTQALYLKGSNLMFGLDVSGLDNALALGYEADGYSTIAMVGYGDGAICVFSGSFDIDQTDDIGQVIAAGLSPFSVIKATDKGEIDRSTVHNSLKFDGSNPVLYVSIGGTYAKYGEMLHP